MRLSGEDVTTVSGIRVYFIPFKEFAFIGRSVRFGVCVNVKLP
jgi:membrane protein YqaA with SNARE-associated domain